jgi:hypothetical protein
MMECVVNRLTLTGAEQDVFVHRWSKQLKAVHAGVGNQKNSDS